MQKQEQEALRASTTRGRSLRTSEASDAVVPSARPMPLFTVPPGSPLPPSLFLGSALLPPPPAGFPFPAPSCTPLLLMMLLLLLLLLALGPARSIVPVLTAGWFDGWLSWKSRSDSTRTRDSSETTK